ncbi:MAG: hypothetical protein ROO71_05185 [Balneola sp.]
MKERQQLNNLITDIEYLQYEAHSLSSVIESVPYSQKPLGGESIIENLISVQEAQKSIIKVLNDLNKQGVDINLGPYSLFKRVELTEQEISERSIKDILQEIENTRSKLLSLITDKPPAFYKLELKNRNSLISVYELLSQMVNNERSSLKEIAGLVLTYQKDKQFQREITPKN